MTQDSDDPKYRRNNGKVLPLQGQAAMRYAACSPNEMVQASMQDVIDSVNQLLLIIKMTDTESTEILDLLSSDREVERIKGAMKITTMWHTRSEEASRHWMARIHMNTDK